MSFNIFDIAGSGMTAQRVKMDTISSNIANIHTTRRPDGSKGAYVKKDVAFRMLSNILGSGGEAYSVLGLLVNQFELMLEVKEMSEDTRDTQVMADTLKMNLYRVKKALSFADKFEKKKLQSILGQLYEIDRNIKTGMIEQNLALELLIGRI